MYKKIQVRDPQLLELEELNDAFYEYLAGEDTINNDAELYGYWEERWNDCRHPEPISFTMDDIYEGYGADWEEGLEVMDHVMSKDLQYEIDGKRRIIAEINGEVEPAWRAGLR